MATKSVSPISAEAHESIEAFKRTVTQELEARVQAKQKMLEQAKLINAPIRALIERDPAAKAALDGFAPYIEQERAKFKNTASAIKPGEFKTMSLVTHGGLSVSVPPYDTQWTSSLFDAADRNAGTFSARSIDSLGYQAAGIGLFVSTTVAENVRFSADAQFHYRWTDLVVHGVAATSGGVGVLVYEGGNAVARTDAVLWDDFQQGTQVGGASDDEVIYLTQTRAGQTYFHMEPNRQYLVWIWSWITATILGNDLAVGVIDATVPFVVLARH